MIGKIATEEHFVSQDAKSYLPDLGVSPDVQRRIDDGLDANNIEQLRLPEMDKHGVEMHLVSLTADGVQLEPDRTRRSKSLSWPTTLSPRNSWPGTRRGLPALLLSPCRIRKLRPTNLSARLPSLDSKAHSPTASATQAILILANTMTCRSSCHSGSECRILTSRFTFTRVVL